MNTDPPSSEFPPHHEVFCEVLRTDAQAFWLGNELFICRGAVEQFLQQHVEDDSLLLFVLSTVETPNSHKIERLENSWICELGVFERHQLYSGLYRTLQQLDSPLYLTLTPL